MLPWGLEARRHAARCPALLVLGLALLGACSPGGEAPAVGLTDGTVQVRPGGEVLERLRGEPPSQRQWREILAVRPGRAVDESLPPMLGDYRLEADRVVFVPRFPLVPGQPYAVRWTGSEPPLEIVLTIERPASEPTTVVAVYPTAEEVPENLLKLYIQLSASMSLGEAHRHIRLFGSDGQEIPAPFVAPQQELWNEARDRLTLIFDPGRTKRGVGPNEALGPNLEVGATYRLVVGAAWSDGRGQPLAEPFEKVFRVVAADRESPRPEDWRLIPPTTPDSPLVVSFPEALDRALLERLLAVEDASGKRVEGHAEISDAETRWSFHPDEAWKDDRYALRAGAALEDLAGNSLRRRFDEPMRQAGAAAGTGLGPAEDRAKDRVEDRAEDRAGDRAGDTEERREDALLDFDLAFEAMVSR